MALVSRTLITPRVETSSLRSAVNGSSSSSSKRQLRTFATLANNNVNINVAKAVQVAESLKAKVDKGMSMHTLIMLRTKIPPHFCIFYQVVLVRLKPLTHCLSLSPQMICQEPRRIGPQPAGGTRWPSNSQTTLTSRSLLKSKVFSQITHPSCSQERREAWRRGWERPLLEMPSCCKEVTVPRASRSSTPTTSGTRSGSCCRWVWCSCSEVKCLSSR